MVPVRVIQVQQAGAAAAGDAAGRGPRQPVRGDTGQ
jgi:hypothetical protein